MPAASCKSKRRALKFSVALIHQTPFALCLPSSFALFRSRAAQETRDEGWRSLDTRAGTQWLSRRERRERLGERCLILVIVVFLINATHLFRGLPLRISARGVVSSERTRRFEGARVTERARGSWEIVSGAQRKMSCNIFELGVLFLRFDVKWILREMNFNESYLLLSSVTLAGYGLLFILPVKINYSYLHGTLRLSIPLVSIIY